MSREVHGTIREREAQDVIRDVLRDKGVSAAIYKFSRGALEILMHDRKVTIPVKRGMTFYELEKAREKIAAVADELQARRRDRKQIDLEEAIASSKTKAA